MIVPDRKSPAVHVVLRNHLPTCLLNLFFSLRQIRAQISSFPAVVMPLFYDRHKPFFLKYRIKMARNSQKIF
jgi:hypothetical protein